MQLGFPLARERGEMESHLSMPRERPAKGWVAALPPPRTYHAGNGCSISGKALWVW